MSKFWQLTRISEEIFGTTERLHQFLLSAGADVIPPELVGRYAQAVTSQDRTILDFEIPDGAVAPLFSSSKFLFYIEKRSPNDEAGGLVIRAHRLTSQDSEMDAGAALMLFGGQALDEAFEYGSFAAPSSKSTS